MVGLQELVLLMAVSSVASQGFGFGFGSGGAGARGGSNSQGQQGFQGFQKGGSFFDGAEQNQAFRNTGVNGILSDRTAVDGLGQTAQSESLFASDIFGDQFLASQTVQGEEVANQAGFTQVDAVENSKGSRNVGITILDQTAFDKGNQVSFAAGAKDAAGIRVFGDTQVGAQSQSLNDVKAAASGQSVDGVQATSSLDEAVRGIDQVNEVNSGRAQFQNNFLQEAGGNQGFFSGQDFGLFEGFVGRRRR